LLALKYVFAYPNPFNPSRGLNFAYTLTESVKKVTLRIFSLDGKLIKEMDGTISVGENRVKWDCLDESGDLILNQVYICRLEAEGARGTISSTIKIAAWGKSE